MFCNLGMFVWIFDCSLFFFLLLLKGSHIRQDSMEPSDLWDDVSNCRCGDRLKTLEQRVKKQHQRCLAHSLVGTPNYIAPEVLLRKGRWLLSLLERHCHFETLFFSFVLFNIILNPTVHLFIKLLFTMWKCEHAIHI